MENSYQFLMIAATMLLGIMLLSIFVYVFRAGAISNRKYEEDQIKQQLIAENAKYEFYNRPDNTFADMISLANLVYDYNKSNDYDINYSMELKIHIGSDEYIIPKAYNSELIRNKIMKGNDSISLYDLASNHDYIKNKELEKIENRIKMAETAISSGEGDINDTLLVTRYDSIKGITIYKYYFYCTNFKYDLETGNLDLMEFTACINSEY